LDRIDESGLPSNLTGAKFWGSALSVNTVLTDWLQTWVQLMERLPEAWLLPPGLADDPALLGPMI
jgi:hypothetical protein